jgi:hypothetical protein
MNTIVDIEKEEMDKLNQFLFLIFQPNPARDTVRIILDDGTIKMTMKRAKFFNIIGQILDDTLLMEAQKIKFRIKEALNTFGGNFYFDRYNLQFRELGEKPIDKKVSPHENENEERRDNIMDQLYEKNRTEYLKVFNSKKSFI